MKKLSVVVVALVAGLAIAAIAIAADGKTTVKTKVEASFSVSGGGPPPPPPPYQPPGSPSPGIGGFSGKVKVKVKVLGTKVTKKKAKKICKKGRTIKVSNGVGKTKTNKRGEFVLLTSPPPPGTYEVKAKRKKKPGKQLVCKPGKTQVTVP